ncbi:hypothetical protein THAPSDRAFT_261566, partial [Thalassiosira pseudonana CCMP1335]
GHKSGLQTATDFAKAEKKLRKKQRDELSQHNLDAETGETVYRDASGKRKTTSTQQKEYRDLKTEEEEKAMKQKLANKGSKQRMEEEVRVRELEEVAGLTLARGVEDTKMEERKKQIIREGDPMAMYAWKLSSQRSSNPVTSNIPIKPTYKGPQPKPNRYGIRPGYRWDGIDRGNGFEDKVLETLHSKRRKKEDAYKWSAADM